MPRLRIGTCRWEYPSWAGLVYSAPEGIGHLAEYAQRCDTVEVAAGLDDARQAPGGVSAPTSRTSIAAGCLTGS